MMAASYSSCYTHTYSQKIPLLAEFNKQAYNLVLITYLQRPQAKDQIGAKKEKFKCIDG